MDWLVKLRANRKLTKSARMSKMWSYSARWRDRLRQLWIRIKLRTDKPCVISIHVHKLNNMARTWEQPFINASGKSPPKIWIVKLCSNRFSRSHTRRHYRTVFLTWQIWAKTENAQREEGEKMENPSENTVKRVERTNRMLMLAVIVEAFILLLIL